MDKNKPECALTHAEDVPQNLEIGVRQQNTLEAGYVRDIMRSETLICTYNRILACLIDSNEYESICIGDIHT